MDKKFRSHDIDKGNGIYCGSREDIVHIRDTTDNLLEVNKDLLEAVKTDLRELIEVIAHKDVIPLSTHKMIMIFTLIAVFIAIFGFEVLREVMKWMHLTT